MAVATNKWISLHIFYAADSNPLLTDCIGPLIAHLRKSSLIERWFFIRYWLEGPHVRLRLLPSSDEAGEKVRQITRERVEQFLERRPSLWEPETEDPGGMFKSMFLAEYTEQQWNERYGEGGSMTFRPNNSIEEIAYEPEFGRYGGPRGMELAERHFEHSSDAIVELLTRTNTHVRTVLLGLSAQMACVLAFTMLGSDEAVAEFFQRYRLSWERRYDTSSEIHHPRFDQSLSKARDELLRRIGEIKAGISGDAPIADFRTSWIEHAAEMRTGITNLTRKGLMSFGDGMEEITDVSIVCAILLTSYIHMTNNRLGVLIQDEIYISYLISKALGLEQQVANVPSAESGAKVAR